VGDEPLLLAKSAPTWAGPNRVLSAEKAIESGASILVLDDGLQNHTLVKDINFLVVDEIQGLGNGMIFPAGPLREPLEKALERIDAVIVIGDESPVVAPNKPLFHAKLQATKRDIGQHVVAFCGMGCPEKFHATLTKQGYTISEFVTFADHHPYTIPDLIQLNRLQKKHDAILITTSKDWLRLPHAYRSIVEVLPVDLVFREPNTFREFVDKELKKYKSNIKNTQIQKVN
jgi:tetraacyldisaccharide 4'-kinase